MYRLLYTAILDPNGKQIDVTDGFNSHDFLDGWSEISFATPDEARAWLAKHHKGPDSAGYTAKFVVFKPEN